jgi:O-antigen/teichoic acid export membrane protein
MLIIPSIGLIIALVSYSKEFMGLLYNNNVNESSLILQLLLIGYLGICISYVYGTLLTAAGNLKILNRTALAGLVINIILNLLLIPRFEAIGTAATSMFTQLVMGFIQMYLSFKFFSIKFSFSIFLKYCLLISILLAFTILFKFFHQNWIISICSIPLISIITGFVLKLVRLENFSQLLPAK